MDFLHDAGEEELEEEEDEEEEEEQDVDAAVEPAPPAPHPVCRVQGCTRGSQTKSWRALMLPLWSFFQTQKGKLR